MGCFMDMLVGSVPEPPLSCGLQAIEIVEFGRRQRVTPPPGRDRDEQAEQEDDAE